MRNILLYILILLAVACKQNSIEIDPNRSIQVDEGFGKYVSEYTQHLISVNDQIVVRFSYPVIEASEVNTIAGSGIFSMSPNVEGEAKWTNVSTLVFTPKTPYNYDQAYTAKVALYKLFKGVPADKREIELAYQTRKLDYRLRLNNITYPNNRKDDITLKGYINSSDWVANEEVEKLLRSIQKDNNVTIEWNHSSGLTHNFEIKNIKRFKEESELQVEWKDDEYGTGFQGEKKIKVTPLGVFKVVNARVTNGESRSFILSFTGELDKRQNLAGLISIKDYKGDFKYDIIGSQITVYPQNKVTSPFVLSVNETILNSEGEKLSKPYSTSFSFEPVKPALKLSGKGVIVPYSEEIIFPFEAINLEEVSVEVFKIFDDNVLQFLQYNRLNTTYSLQPVGRIIHQEKVRLSDFNEENNDANYTRYALDLRKMIRPDPGSIYQIRIGFGKEGVVDYPCKEATPELVLSKRDGFTSIMQSNTNYDGYNWNDRNDPCKPAFYNSSRFITRNVLASNIGIIAKVDKQKTVSLILSDLRTVSPINGAETTFYDFQQQEIMKATVGSGGILKAQLDRNPAFAIVDHNGSFGYINLQKQHANSLSEFDVSGKSKKKGIDGYIYGERGVWRPGDTLFLNFMLEDKTNKLPAQHPVTMTVKDAKGKQKYSKTTNTHLGHVYNFPVSTLDSDPTGNWSAIVTVGGSSFQKTLKVETVKPNRLKIEYDLTEGEALPLFSDQNIALSSKWLHGAPADGLKAKVDMQVSTVLTKFTGYSKYVFDDPARKVEPNPFTVFDGNLSAEGNAFFRVDQKKNWLAPGKLKANFKTKVFEKGGNFSEDNFTAPVDLYQSYVGIKVPQTRWGSKFIRSGKSTNIPLVVVDTKGKPIANRSLSVGVYQARWSWWYDRGYSDKYNYNSAQHNGAWKKGKATTDANGSASFPLKLDDDYGNYMIRVCDDVTGHCTGDMFYSGRYWRNRGEQEGPMQLKFETDKKLYAVGEKIEVKIPSNERSKILISIENGEKVLQTFWVDGVKDETTINVPTDPSMNSNVYIHAHLVQPHNNGNNDLPMRMYGVVPLSVVDPASQIKPEIEMEASIRPNEEFTVKVSEKLGKSMTYTLAVVDEGLLDLTRFKTPEAWNHFYAKQALGVKTWDIYDMVLDGYGGALDRYISIGGDAEYGAKKKGKKANRFVPVVKHLGPFILNVGEQKTHKLKMPNYVGSVRTMVVARNLQAYGSEDMTTPVKKPLMVLATLPRVLGPNETLSLPANVFAMEEKIKDVKVSVETSENIALVNGSTENLSFSKVGDKQAYFDLKVSEATGNTKVKVRASGHGEGAFEEVNIEIRNPNPYTSNVFEAAIEPGQKWNETFELFGTDGSNEGVLELSNMPPMNFSKRLRYLVRYPYGCIEQTTSSVFPQLYLNEVTELSDSKKARIDDNIAKGIDRLALFQTSSGGLGYWPGDNDVNEWGTNYAGHFLIEAKDKGYFVPDYMLKNILRYQNEKAKQATTEQTYQMRTQAYRLYMLAKGGSPNIGAMNRLRKVENLDLTSAHVLAASYAIVGKVEIAKELIANKGTEVKPYIETGRTYGSDLRDMAMIAEAQQIIGNKTEVAMLIKEISARLSSRNWYGTQTTAYALMSIGKFLSSYESDDLKYSYKVNNGSQEKGISTKPSVQKTLNINKNKSQNIEIVNDSKAIMYARFVLSGQLPPGEEEKGFNRHVKLSVTYLDQNGGKIDPSNIKQGTDFTARVAVENLGSRGWNIEELALAQIFPSGWEIQNDRMSTLSNTNGNSRADYRDIRDDRVYTFFDMNRQGAYTFSVNLNATYAGRFYLPPVYVEAMYNNEIQAKTEGQWVEVVK